MKLKKIPRNVMIMGIGAGTGCLISPLIKNYAESVVVPEWSEYGTASFLGGVGIGIGGIIFSLISKRSSASQFLGMMGVTSVITSLVNAGLLTPGMAKARVPPRAQIRPQIRRPIQRARTVQQGRSFGRNQVQANAKFMPTGPTQRAVQQKTFQTKQMIYA